MDRKAEVKLMSKATEEIRMFSFHKQNMNKDTIARLKKEKEDLNNEKELTMSQEKLDHIDEQIFEIDDSLKKLGVVNV